MTVLEAGAGARRVPPAFHLTRSDRPGPVHIDLPIDVQMRKSTSIPRPTNRFR